MESAAFESPLTDEMLKELGRLVVNCGFVEFLLNIHAGMFFQLSETARMDLIAPLTTKRKIDIITARLGEIQNLETRRLVKDAIDMINPTIRARNNFLHGIWGMDAPGADAKPVVVSPKANSGHHRAEEICGHADTLAVASCMLLTAMATDNGGASPKMPGRLVIELASPPKQ